MLTSAKKILVNVFAFALAAFFLPSFCEASHFPLCFNQLSQRDGLSSSVVFCVHQDRNGFVWIGTNDGLNLFDGVRVKVFRNLRADSGSLAHNRIRSIAETPDGRLWVGTGAGVSLMDTRSGRCRNFGLESGLPEDADNIAYCDSKGTLWVGSNKGLVKFQPEDSTFAPVHFPKNEPGHFTRVACIYEDPDGSGLWIGTYEGLYHISADEKAITGPLRISEDPNKNQITSVLRLSPGRMVVGSWAGGLCVLEGSGDVYRPEHCHLWETHPVNPYSTNIVQSVVMLEGDLFAATNNGIWYLSNEELDKPDASGSFQQVSPDDPFALLSNYVSQLHLSPSGILWVATSGGLNYAVPSHQLFRLETPPIPGSVMRIRNDDPRHPGQFWSCSWYGEGLCLHEADGNIVNCYNVFGAAEDRMNMGQVSDVVRRHDGSLWVGTFGGLFRFDEASGKGQGYFPDSTVPGSIATSRINCLAEDRYGNLWIGTYGKGISLLGQGRDDFISLPLQKEGQEGVPSNLIWNIREAADHRLWFAANNGLYIVTPSAPFDKQRLLKTALSITEVNTGKGKVPLQLVNAILPLPTGEVWVASSSGVFRFNAGGDCLQHYDRENGFAHSNACGLAMDREGNLWVATSNGLSRMDAATGHIFNFNHSMGLRYTNLDGLFLTWPDGSMVLALDQKWMRFRPGDFNASAESLSVFITRVTIAGKKTLFPSTGNKADVLSLPWSENNISFEYVTPAFHGPEFISYYCRFRGTGEDWMPMGQQPNVSYASLQPGDYVFEVKAVDRMGRSSEPALYTFQIYPPFWRTAWFFILVIVLVVTLLFFIIRYVSTQRLREKILRLEKAQAIEQERSRISRDMHDELGAGLTQISIMSELAKRKTGKGEEGPYVDSIAHTSRELVTNLNEIIWTLNPVNDTLKSLAAYLRESTDKLLEPSGIALQVDFPSSFPELHLSEEKRRNIFLILKEGAHNIMKHSGAANAWLGLDITEEAFTFSLRDDGRGFDLQRTRENGNGLHNMNKRAEAIPGTLFIASAPGKGTEIRLLVMIG